MKVLFVSRHTGSRTFPLASASNASSLESRFGDRVDCRFLEYSPGFDVESAALQIMSETPDVLGLSICSWSREDLLALAAAVRENSRPKKPVPFIIAGGPEPSGEASMAEGRRQAPGLSGIIGNPDIGLVVSGEGEEAIVDIIVGMMDPDIGGRPEGLRRAGIGRPFSSESFRDRVLMLHEYGVVYGLDLIWGLPGDSLQGFRRSLDFALSCAPNHLDMFPLSILPGTRLKAEAAERGLHHQAGPPYTVTGSAIFTAEDLEKAAVLAGRTDFLYNECRAVPWFLILCEAVELEPVELIVRAAELAGDEKPPQQRRPEWLQHLVRDLARAAGRDESAEILGDLVAVLILESAARQGLDDPEAMTITYRPDILLGHLEMRITDIEELSAFVPVKPGGYRIASEAGELAFEGIRK